MSNTIRPKEGQERHDRGVMANAKALVSGGWAFVYADLPGATKPPMIGGYVPDIYARHGNLERVIEVETADTINSEHARSQLAAFRSWAAVSSSRTFEVKLV